jgi:carboxymethylenebutenolidase
MQVAKPLAAYDTDAAAVIAYLRGRLDCTGRLGTTGMCLGGHLALRCALHPAISACFTWFATDVHSATLGAGKQDDTLTRCRELSGETMLVFGKQDPHTPAEGIARIHAALSAANCDFSWFEVNAQHAFTRCESSKGRYDPQLTRLMSALMRDLFHRQLQLGVPSNRSAVPAPVVADRRATRLPRAKL